LQKNIASATRHVPSAIKNKVFTHGEVEYHRCKNVGAKGIGGEKADAFDKNTHQHRAQKGTYPRDRVKEKYLNDDVVFSTLKNKKYVGDIGNHVGKEKGDKIADHGIAGSCGVINFSDAQIEQPNCEILFLQRGKDLPGDNMKNDDMRNAGQNTGQGVFNKLQDGRVVYAHCVSFRWTTGG
jgi:hypothetical protein